MEVTITVVKYSTKQNIFTVINSNYICLNLRTGQLLDHIQNRIKFTEKEASYVIKDLASALQFLHKKGNAQNRI